jgi:NAD(P)-dependent dehydrogenase (short-subunit alcohol dehydrogenase family)
MRLKDKVAIVTGGGQGIGREYALRFAREGAKVVIGDIRDAQAKEVIQEIKDLGGDGLALRTDVSKEEDTKRLADTTHEHFGKIDILLNNAAIFYDMDLNDRSLEYFNKILSVNLTGVWLCTRAVETYMKRQRRGKIIHQSSTAAYMGNAGVVDTSDPELPSPAPHYSVTKIGVSGLTKYMAGYLGPWGINVNTICPGLTLTEAAKRIVPEDMMSMLPMFTALKRALQPQDLTGTAVFLASEDSDAMTGQVLVVDCGMIMLG